MKNHFSYTYGRLRKQIAAAALIALAIALPVATTAASMVKIEANTTVANATKSGSWAGSTTASYNQVVAVQVVYNNKEAAGSGKTANDLHVKINIPSKAGKDQTITTKTSATNSNIVNDSAKVTLGSADAFLQYIPGTATWKHATTANGPLTQTEKISDDVVLKADGASLGKEKPCQAGSVVVQARVMIPGTKVVKEVEKADETNKWSQNNTANPGDTLKYRITYQNTGNTQAQNVIVRDNLPPKMTIVPNTTRVYSSIANGVVDTSNNLTNGGLNVGNPMPGAIVYVTFEAKVADATNLDCGANTYRNIGIAHPKAESEYYNVAVTTVNKVCANTASYVCKDFDVTVDNASKTVTVSQFHTEQTGATFNNVVIDWGDGSQALTTNTPVGQKHTYVGDSYNVTATSHFTANGKDVTAAGCAKSGSFTTPTTPTTGGELPHTGAGQVFALFGAVFAVATVAHRLFVSRRQFQK